MKRYTLHGFLFFVFATGTVLADNSDNAGPFSAVWDAIAGIQNQIDNLEPAPTLMLEVQKILNQQTAAAGLVRTEATCPEGTLLTGGGAITGDARSKLINTEPSPFTPNTWSVIYDNPFQGIINGAYAMCAKLK